MNISKPLTRRGFIRNGLLAWTAASAAGPATLSIAHGGDTIYEFRLADGPHLHGTGGTDHTSFDAVGTVSVWPALSLTWRGNAF